MKKSKMEKLPEILKHAIRAYSFLMDKNSFTIKELAEAIEKYYGKHNATNHMVIVWADMYNDHVIKI